MRFRPTSQRPTGEVILVPYTDEMIKNLPEVFKSKFIKYKVNDSGLFMIRVKDRKQKGLMLLVTECATDSACMTRARKRNQIFDTVLKK